MLRFLSSNKGMGMIEVIMAILLTSVGIISMMSLQPQALKTVARSDYLGRAAGIVYGQMQIYEYFLMNPNSIVTNTTMTWTENAYSSMESSPIDASDLKFTIKRTITKITANSWRFTVTVSWPPLNGTGITESMVVTRQDRFKDKMNE